MSKQWYIINTFPEYENRVKSNLERKIKSLGLETKFGKILVPTEEVAEMKKGERVITEKKIFPGYVFVEMEMDDETWAVVRNTPGVTKFVGAGKKPTPISESEVKEIMRNMGLLEGKPRPRPKTRFEVGDKIKVIDGPFKDFVGTVEEIDMERNKMRVMITIFGRATPVELDFLQVEKV